MPYVTSWPTGSGLPAILLVDGVSASQSYNVPIRKSDGGCPHCHGPVDTVLMFNPTDGTYVLNCPICGYFIKYYNFDGTPTDFAIIKSTKTTSLDVDLNVEDRYTY